MKGPRQKNIWSNYLTKYSRFHKSYLKQEWWLLTGIVQFWIYNIFHVLTKETFLWKIHLDNTTPTRNNWGKWWSKSIRVIYMSDWLWVSHFLDYFESELYYLDGPFIKKKVSFVGTRKKMLYSKLVNNSIKNLRYTVSLIRST